MKYIVRKAFWNYEKEEKWLNEMSSKGMALTDYSWCRYVFTESPNNEYIYRIELLDKLPTHPESIVYIRFLEENGVECVATYMRWIYLRKKSSEGAFDIYSDIDSRLRHYKKINTLNNALMGVEFAAGLCNIAVAIVNPTLDYRLGSFTNSNFIIGGVLLILGMIFFTAGMPIRKKIRMLKKDKAIIE